VLITLWGVGAAALHLAVSLDMQSDARTRLNTAFMLSKLAALGTGLLKHALCWHLPRRATGALLLQQICEATLILLVVDEKNQRSYPCTRREAFPMLPLGAEATVIVKQT